MKNSYLGLGILILIGCASSLTISDRLNTSEIFPSLQLTDTDSTKIYELKFKPVYSAMDAQRLMFEKYGKWDNAISIDRKYPILVWTDVQLFDWSDELYTVGAGGEKKGPFYYCSAFVFNSKGEDCFAKNEGIKDSLRNYFIRGTGKLKQKDPQFKTLVKSAGL